MTEEKIVCPECDSTDIKDGRCTRCFYQVVEKAKKGK